MYAQVVVLTYQPPDIDSYTYEIPKELEDKVKIGQLVAIPFGKRQPMGVIIETSHQRPETRIRKPGDWQVETGNLKEVSQILLQAPLLLPYQIELLKWMAFYYHAPMVNCLEAMLPEIPKKLSVYSSQFTENTVDQTIVLVPTINRIPETLARYREAKNYAVYHNELKTSEKFSTWLKILSNNVDFIRRKTLFIFGSRLAVFAPCPNLTKIIIYNEHENFYKDERSPYYNTLTVAEKISELTGCKIKIIDSSPRITTYFAYKVRPSTRSHLVKVKIVNMQDERRAGNKSPISLILEEYIRRGLTKGKKILLFLNKKTESGHLYCTNCKYSDFASHQPEVCPNCQSRAIWFSSTNVNSLANLVRKIVPQARITIIAESHQLLTTNYQLPTIDIATASVFYKLQVARYDLVAHIQTDFLANIADYSSAERLFAQITSLKEKTRGLLLLQTYKPDNPTITTAAEGNYQKFFARELAARKALSYPPFSLLVKLTIRGKKEEKTEEKAHDLFAQLNKFQVSSFKFPATILGPYKSIFTAKTAKYNIILKLPVKNYSLDEREKAMSLISPLLSQVPGGWQVEIEAQSIT